MTLAGALLPAAAAALAIAVAAPLRLRSGPVLRAVDDDGVAGPDRTGDRSADPFGARHRRRTRTSDPVDLSRWCDALARDVRAGSSLRAALESNDAPNPGAFGDVPHRLRRGASIAGAVEVRSGSLDERTVAAVLAAVAQHGGDAAQPLDRVAATLRRRVADRAERAVHSAQARLSALVMTSLPLAVLVLLVATSAPVRTVLVTPVGAVVVVVGGMLNATGWWWMRRLIRGRGDGAR